MNGREPHGYTIGGSPDGLYWSWAVIAPRAVDVGAALGDLGVTRS